MNSVRDIFLTLVSALTFVQFLPRVEPAQIPQSSTPTPSATQASTPGVFQQLQNSFRSTTPIQAVSFTENAAPVTSAAEAAADNSTPNGAMQRSANFHPAGDRAELLSGGEWVSVELIRSTPRGYVVRFPGQSVSYLVPNADLRFENSVAPGQDSGGPNSVSVWHCGEWCSCQVLEQDGHMFRIHLVGAPANRNEWVSQRMIRFPRGEADSSGERDE